MFAESVKGVSVTGAASIHVLELARDYASDSKSFLGKEDLYTAFSCISYAHGLLDALKEISGQGNR
jgi:hypothetical protein